MLQLHLDKLGHVEEAACAVRLRQAACAEHTLGMGAAGRHPRTMQSFSLPDMRVPGLPCTHTLKYSSAIPDELLDLGLLLTRANPCNQREQEHGAHTHSRLPAPPSPSGAPSAAPTSAGRAPRVPRRRAAKWGRGGVGPHLLHPRRLGGSIREVHGGRRGGGQGLGGGGERQQPQQPASQPSSQRRRRRRRRRSRAEAPRLSSSHRYRCCCCRCRRSVVRQQPAWMDGWMEGTHRPVLQATSTTCRSTTAVVPSHVLQ